MIDEGVYKEYAAALEAASDLVNEAVIELEREIGHLTGDDLAQAMAASYASIVGEYGQVAAEAALEFYASVRNAASVEQGYDPVPAQGKSVQTLSRDVGGVMETAQAALSDRLKNLGGMAIRRTMEQASDTIIKNARSDKAHPRWAIVPRMGACGWCIMLGSQGFVYSSDRTATSARHPWCKCVTVVDFDAENPSLKGYDEGGMYDRYLSCRKAIEQDAERRWDAMDDAEKARYGGNGRSDYDHYLRNRIVAEMNTRDREWLRTGAVPSITKDGKARPLPKEEKVANILARNGFAVHFRETRSAQGKRTSDVLLGGEGGVPYEIKQPKGNGKQTVYHQFEEAIGQSSKLIIDATAIINGHGGIEGERRWNEKTVYEAVSRYINWHYSCEGRTEQFEEVLLIFDEKKIKRIKRGS